MNDNQYAVRACKNHPNHAHFEHLPLPRPSRVVAGHFASRIFFDDIRRSLQGAESRCHEEEPTLNSSHRGSRQDTITTSSRADPTRGKRDDQRLRQPEILRGCRVRGKCGKAGCFAELAGCGLYIGSRLVYIPAYIYNDTVRAVYTRSAVFAIGLIVNVALFVLAGIRLNKTI